MPALPSHVTPTLAAIHANRVKSRWAGRGSTFIAASEAGQECARAIWYGFRWASPPESANARMLRLFATGDREEKRILADLSDVPGVTVWDRDPETAKQFRAELSGYVAVKVDAVALGLPEAPKSPHVVECKTANDKSFVPIKAKGVQKGKPEHWLQVQLGMAGLAIKRGLYFLVNKNTDEEYVERIKPDAEAVERAVARLVSIAESPRPPGKIRDDATKPPCMFCQHRGVCHDSGQARANCRTCAHSTPRAGGIWRCEKFNNDLTPEDQERGCSAQVFIPDLVNGEQFDADIEAGTISYRMKDGSVWVDGAGRAAP